MSNDGSCPAKCRSAKQDNLFQVGTIVPLSVLHYLRTTVSHKIIEKRFCGNNVFILLLILLKTFRADQASEEWWQALPQLCVPTAELKYCVHISMPFGEKHYSSFVWLQLCLPDSVFIQRSWGGWLFAELRRLGVAAGAAGSCSGHLNPLGWNLRSARCQGLRSDVSSHVSWTRRAPRAVPM